VIFFLLLSTRFLVCNLCQFGCFFVGAVNMQLIIVLVWSLMWPVFCRFAFHKEPTNIFRILIGVFDGIVTIYVL
jgi:hypothetical protein